MNKTILGKRSDTFRESKYLIKGKVKQVLKNVLNVKSQMKKTSSSPKQVSQHHKKG